MSLLLGAHWPAAPEGPVLEFPEFAGSTTGLKTARVTFKPNGEIWDSIDSSAATLAGYWRTGGGAGAAYTINGLAMNISHTFHSIFSETVELEFTVRRAVDGVIVGGGTWNLITG